MATPDLTPLDPETRKVYDNHLEAAERDKAEELPAREFLKKLDLKKPEPLAPR